MKNSFCATLFVNLVLVSTFVPVAFADHEGNRNGNGHGYGRYNNHNYKAARRSAANAYRNNQYNYGHSTRYGQRVASNNNWQWDQHNWNDQRSQLRNNWRLRNDRLSAQQQQQLDEQMRAQWLRYHNNQWNGPNNWSQYSDPNFLDYIHTNNPSLMTRIRSAVGY